VSAGHGDAGCEKPIVVGIGNETLGDDGVGIAAARGILDLAGDRLNVAIDRSGGSGLPGLWNTAEKVVLIDAMSSGEPAGTIRRFDLGADPPEVASFRSSTHAFGILEAVNLERELGRLPAEVIAFGVEGREFTPGSGLSPEVAAALENVIADVLLECGAQRHRE
jgi:hydrogenase maturation protease